MKPEITATIEIKDSDIATIEALHDILLDKGILELGSKTLINARELTMKMYAAIKDEKDKSEPW